MCKSESKTKNNNNNNKKAKKVNTSILRGSKRTSLCTRRRTEKNVHLLKRNGLSLEVERKIFQPA